MQPPQKELFLKLQTLSESNFWSNTEKFIFIATRPASDKDVFQIVLFFHNFRVLNSLIITPASNSFKVFSYNPYFEVKETVYAIDISVRNVDHVYEDKLKNLQNYSLKLVAYREPRNFIEKNFGFLNEVCKIRNASYHIQFLLDNAHEDFNKKYLNLMISKEVDLSVNTGMQSVVNGVRLPSVITYEQKAYCALIPIPIRTSFFELLLKPFDTWTWILLIVSVLICAVFWNFYDNHQDSACYFIFGVFANFLGQSIPFRNNRRIQLVLLQLCIMMTFILGNAFQSILIAFLSESRNGTRLATLNDLMKSDYKVKADPVFYDIIEASNEFPDFMKRVQKLYKKDLSMDFHQVSLDQIALIIRCDFVEDLFYYRNISSGPVELFYRLPENFYKSFVRFELCDDSPYQEMFQHFSDRMFESGLKEYWKHVIRIFNSSNNRIEIESRYFVNEEYMLKMSDLKPVFFGLVFCHFAATLMFLLEIFWCHFLQKLQWSMICPTIWNDDKKSGRKNKGIIQVRPVNT